MTLTFQEELRTSKLSLDELLLKHGLNLKTVFERKKPEVKRPKKTIPVNITYVEGRFQIKKMINKEELIYGSYDTVEDAITVKEQLIKHNWDKNKLEVILEETGVKRRRPTNETYTLWNSSHVTYNKHLKGRKRFRVALDGRCVNCGCFQDPISCEIVYELIKEALD